ncbi:MAG: class II fructose-bisphosphatase [Deferribacteres bacterium]|nr:class II fructose-bisphosphatase [candidate division KSB1 bacterium]MCB9503764.1 class II fructose-bisphosphatase [Deferribacteres bacterium]
MPQEACKRNLGLDLVRVTEAAALSAARWLGRGNKEAGDGAAVDAMRWSFNAMDIDGRVVIGEGEKDEAPMLYNGEELGTKKGPQMDVAVDPVEGTSLLATGKPNAISVVSLAPRGTMFNPGPAFYMEKLVVGPKAKEVIDLNAPIETNLRNIAKALSKDVDDLVVFVLERPRHEKLITEIRKAGARIQLHSDGDVAGAIMAVSDESTVDVMMGIGGTPEGVLAATAIKIIGGEILCRLAPQSQKEKDAVLQSGYNLNTIYSVNDLIRSEDIYFAATGISGRTSGLRGVQYTGQNAITHSIMMKGETGTIRYIESHIAHGQLMKINAMKQH